MSRAAHASLSRLFLTRNDSQQATVHLRHYLRLVPEDHIGARLLLAHTGAEAPPARPTPAYLTRFYDNYADSYDHKLVHGLHYQCPQLILPALQKHCRGKVAILDLGCGTGLCGQAVRPLGKAPGRGGLIAPDGGQSQTNVGSITGWRLRTCTHSWRRKPAAMT